MGLDSDTWLSSESLMISDNTEDLGSKKDKNMLCLISVAFTALVKVIALNATFKISILRGENTNLVILVRQQK